MTVIGYVSALIIFRNADVNSCVSCYARQGGILLTLDVYYETGWVATS